MRTIIRHCTILLVVLGMASLLISPVPSVGQENSKCAYPGCEEKILETSREGYCIFHARPEDKDVRDFNIALDDYIDKMLDRYDFSGFVFVGDTDFSYEDIFGLRDAVGLKNANFTEAKFWGNVNFGDVLFNGDTNFSYAEFNKDALFTGALFRGNVNFSEARFHGEALFLATKFRRVANFWRTRFYRGTNFWFAEFHENANFSMAVFQGSAHISPEFIKEEISFSFATLENVSLTPLGLDEHAFIDLRNAILRNTQIRREDIEGHIVQEQTKDFSGAKEIYLILKNNFNTLGRYDDQSWAFQKEKEMERKSYFKNRNYPMWTWSKFLSFLYGYGERPERVIISATVIIVFFAFLFMNLGIITSEKVELRHNIFRLKGMCWKDFWSCLYFSVVTFTTLGYGDFRPLKGRSRSAAGLEAFIGAFMMALFVYTFARTIGGR